MDASVWTEATLYGQKGQTAPIVLAFRANQEALVSSVGIQCRVRDGKPQTDSLPAAVRVHASRSDPFRDYVPVGEFSIEPRAEEQVFSLPAPARARFLKFDFALPPAPDPERARVAHHRPKPPRPVDRPV